MEIRNGPVDSSEIGPVDSSEIGPVDLIGPMASVAIGPMDSLSSVSPVDAVESAPCKPWSVAVEMLVAGL